MTKTKIGRARDRLSSPVLAEPYRPGLTEIVGPPLLDGGSVVSIGTQAHACI